MKRLFHSNKTRLRFFLCLVSLIILTLPRFDIGALSNLVSIINVLKVLSVIVVLLLFIVEKPRLSRFSKIFIAFFLYIVFITLINGVDPITVLKTYSLNFSIILLFEIIMQANFCRKLMSFFTNYFIVLLFLNLIQVIVYRILGVTEQPYILGMDNRFVLYSLLVFVAGYYVEGKYATVKRFLSLIIGFFSVLLTWSVSAMIIMFLIILMCFFFEKTKARFHISVKVACILILTLSIMLVLFRFHESFWPVVENIIHKNSSLSFRTFIWDVGLEELMKNPVRVLFGFGFYEVKDLLSIIPYTAAHVIHFHNLFLELLFSGGIIGLVLYSSGLLCLGGELDRLRKNKRKIGNQLAIVFMGMLILMMFDVFEYYQVYYGTLILMFYVGFLECNKGEVPAYEKR